MRVDTKVRSSPLRRRLRRLGRLERAEEAAAFLAQLERELGVSGVGVRRRAVVRDLLRHGFYEHTPEELAFGARVAWRNHARCIGRLTWDSLVVADCRAVTEPDEVAGRCFQHLREAGGRGAIRSMISVFAPFRPNEAATPAYVESRQLFQYAGYPAPGGGILGDPINAEATRSAVALGWRPPAEPGRFDPLPLLVRDGRERRLVFPTPEDAVRQVGIEHPSEPGVAGLGLRWYAVPCVSSMILTIGGVEYPCAPFNGHYMCTEIASRNLADPRRYNLLPEVAEALGIDRARDLLWKDRALTELNAAVLHSFRREGVTIVDHHDASEQYMRFIQREASEGRRASGDWSWVVPPQASSACPVFHLPMEDRGMVPNFYQSRAIDGNGLFPSYDDRRRSRARVRFDRLRRRWYAWRRIRD
ncbi:MAG: nitric oxide synthase oxygenase [Phycisphaerales bacterium]|nr:nitric oxide synthase oxygenase [Planctomycetota bacterium]MCH8508495.1 nitric oxide synthase oxygenase [Phycisphaerales bacterium]